MGDRARKEVKVPGWYADPSGEGMYRYWNGEAWTGLVAANLREVKLANVGKEAEPSPNWNSGSRKPKKPDVLDSLLPWVIADEKTGKTPLGQLLFFIAWVALTVFLLNGGC